MFAGSQLGNLSLFELLGGVLWAFGILAVSAITYRLVPFKYRNPTPPRELSKRNLGGG